MGLVMAGLHTVLSMLAVHTGTVLVRIHLG